LGVRMYDTGLHAHHHYRKILEGRDLKTIYLYIVNLYIFSFQ